MILLQIFLLVVVAYSAIALDEIQTTHQQKRDKQKDWSPDEEAAFKHASDLHGGYDGWPMNSELFEAQYGRFQHGPSDGVPSALEELIGKSRMQRALPNNFPDPEDQIALRKLMLEGKLPIEAFAQGFPDFGEGTQGFEDHLKALDDNRQSKDDLLEQGSHQQIMERLTNSKNEMSGSEEPLENIPNED